MDEDEQTRLLLGADIPITFNGLEWSLIKAAMTTTSQSIRHYSPDDSLQLEGLNVRINEQVRAYAAKTYKPEEKA